MPTRADFAAWIVATGMLVVCASPAWGHHAFAGTYSLDKSVEIEGQVVEFLFRNPHSVVIIESVDGRRQRVTWSAEWRGAGELSRSGIDSRTLRPGDRVVVIGNPSRNPSDRRVHLQSIARSSDGWKWTSSAD